MGIFSWFKNLFKKSISANNISDNQLVALARDNAKIKFGTPLDVKQNFLSVLVYKNKIMDIFEEGKYRLDVPVMPLLSRYQKLTKPNKKGDLPNHFKTDIYFINKKIFQNLSFNNCLIHIKNKAYKGFNVKAEGQYSFQITSPIDFLEALFTQYGVVNNGIAKTELNNWIKSLVAKKIEKNKPSVDDLYSLNAICFDGLLDYINKDISDCGVKLLEINVSKVNFPKRVYKKISISQQKLSPEKVEQYTGEYEISPNPVKQAQEADFANQMNDVYKSQADKIEQDMQSRLYVTNSDGVDSADIKTSIEIPVQNGEISNNKVMDDVSFVDGEINVKQDDIEEAMAVRKVFEYKKCAHCGALNSKDSSICFSCKNRI